MRQELTVESNIISFLYENRPNLRRNITTDLIDLLEKNDFCDNNEGALYKRFVAKVNQIEDERFRQEFRNLIVEWFTNPKKYHVESEDTLSVCMATEDRILLDTDLTNSARTRRRIKYPEVEFHNSKSLVNSEITDRFIRLPRSIKFEKKVTYSFDNIFTPYFRHSNTIHVIDPFIYNEKAFINFKKLLSIKDFSTVNVTAHQKHNYLNRYRGNEKDYRNFEKYMEKLQGEGKETRILEFGRAQHYDRYIILDELEIRLPSGLDFWDEDGFANVSDDELDKAVMEIKYIDKNLEY